MSEKKPMNKAIIPFLTFVIVSGGIQAFQQIKRQQNQPTAEEQQKQKDTAAAIKSFNQSQTTSAEKYQAELDAVDFIHFEEYTEEEKLDISVKKVVIINDIKNKSFSNVEADLETLRQLQQQLESRFV